MKITIKTSRNRKSQGNIAINQRNYVTAKHMKISNLPDKDKHLPGKEFKIVVLRKPKEPQENIGQFNKIRKTTYE